MEQDLKQRTPCRSIFKDGRTVTDAKAYTKAWIALIDQTERGKHSGVGGNHGKDAAM